MINEIESRGIEVKLKVPARVITENLERIGIVNRKNKKLFPSCYLVENFDKFFICHFKDLLKVPGSDENDKKRRNTIIWLFAKWGLLTSNLTYSEKDIMKRKLFILTKEQKENEKWEICHKWHNIRNKTDNNLNRRENNYE